ncbi:hypothetical protein HHSLTHF2_27610 [Vreelandella venusta]|uniref:Uncharacterized protein n=1 Tax=Halomonas hydrothermalis TaxID=115561 RepID=A0A6F8U6U6_9GAMM|nr:hypothetical protein [Halomonas hydrothermalis]BCB08871.1 hypothetical protein HHSLTHF2_27610 [Halomonas hydrothermalis]
MTQLAPDTQEMLDSLRTAVAETLERKRRLGQYAVIWQDGKPVLVGDDAPAHQPGDQDSLDRESH